MRSCNSPTARTIRASSVCRNATDARPREASDAAQVELDGLVRILALLLGVRVDERDLDAIAAGRGDEQELVTVRNGLLDDRRRERRQEVALERALERTGAELGAEALLDQERVRGVVDLDGPRPAAQPTPRESVSELLVEQRAHGGPLERAEDDDPVEPVHELRAERGADGARCRRSRTTARKARTRRRATHERRADVGREHDHAAPEVDDAALEIGEPPVVEDLEEEVENGLSRLLELVEQDHRERVLPDRGDQRCPVRLGGRVGEQPVERLRRLVLAHVEADEPVRGAEEELRERLRDLGLAGACRADEEEHAERPSGIGDAGLDHRDALDDAVDGLRLLEHASREERAHLLERKRSRRVEERERKPELAASVASTSRPSKLSAPCSAASAAVARRSRRRFPGGAMLGRNCWASSNASASVSSSVSTSSGSCSSACRATAIVSASSSGRTRTISRRRSSRAAARRPGAPRRSESPRRRS